MNAIVDAHTTQVTRAEGWALLDDALHDRLAEIDKRRDGSDTARDARVQRLLEFARHAVHDFEESFAATAALRRLARKAFAPHTHDDNVGFDAFAG